MGYYIADRAFMEGVYSGEKDFRIFAVLDSDADLSALGTNWAPGSIALVADKDGATYMMSPGGEWKEQ